MPPPTHPQTQPPHLTPGPSLAQVVLGYWKVALVAAAANAVAGVLVYVRSAHDDLRRDCAALLRAQGIRISRQAGAGGALARDSVRAHACPHVAARRKLRLITHRHLCPRCRLGTAAAGGSNGAALQGGLQAAASGEAKGAPSSSSGAQQRCLGGIRAYVDARVAACAAAAGIDADACGLGAGAAAAASSEGPDSVANTGLLPLPESASDAELELTWNVLEMSLKTVRVGPGLAPAMRMPASAACCCNLLRPSCTWLLPQAKLEPPLPLMCSQPGSSPIKYAALKAALLRLQQATAVLGRGQAACLHALRAGEGSATTAPATHQLRAALAEATALAAAACAGAAETLAHMPALAPCSGAALRWRPLPADAWAEARAVLARAAQGLAAAYQEGFGQQGLDFALALGVQQVGGRCGLPRIQWPAATRGPSCWYRCCPAPPGLPLPTCLQHRALLFSVAEAAELLDCAQAAEAAAADALGVPPAAEPRPAGPGSTGKPAVPDVEDGKLGREMDTRDAAVAAPRPSALHRLAANPFVSSAAILLLLASPVPLVALVAAACWRAAKALPELARSRDARHAGEARGCGWGTRDAAPTASTASTRRLAVRIPALTRCSSHALAQRCAIRWCTLL